MKSVLELCDTLLCSCLYIKMFLRSVIYIVPRLQTETFSKPVLAERMKCRSSGGLCSWCGQGEAEITLPVAIHSETSHKQQAGIYNPYHPPSIFPFVISLQSKFLKFNSGGLRYPALKASGYLALPPVFWILGRQCT